MNNIYRTSGIVAGLSGGICCGKSTVSKTFMKNNIPVVDADLVARKVVEPGTLGHDCLHATFGKDYFISDKLDRQKLGNLVFNNPEKMILLNAIMAPLIADEAAKEIEELSKNNRIVVYDAALIIEQGDADKYRPLIVVSCPVDIQLARLMKRNGFSQEEAMARIESQMPLAKKIEVSNFVVDTSGTIENSVAQTEKIIDQLIIMNTKQGHSKMDRLP